MREKLPIIFVSLIFISHIDSTHQTQHLPLFVTKTNGRYELADSLSHNIIDDEYEIIASEDNIVYYACPKPDDQQYPNAVQIAGTISQTVNMTKSSCDVQVTPTMLKTKLQHPRMTQYRIGFLIYDTEGTFSSANEYENLPKTYDMLPLLTVNYDNVALSPISVQHTIKQGYLLRAIPNHVKKIENLDLFVDRYYSEERQRPKIPHFQYPLYALKKIRLASEDDFALPNCDKVADVNVNTAPMWTILYYQWRNVEIFVRKLAKVLDKLIVETGVKDVLKLRTIAENQHTPMYLNYDEGANIRQYPVPKYFYKKITYTEYNNEEEYTRGVLIVMHNYMFDDSEDLEPICDDISIEIGWTIANQHHQKGRIYCCPLNGENMRKLNIQMEGEYEQFNLYELKSPNRNTSVFNSMWTG